MFGGGRRRSGGGRRVRAGDSLQVGLSISLEEAAAGCSKELEIERGELCDTCNGSGAAPGSVAESCSYCGGHGQVVQSQGFFRVQQTCPQCRGEGTVIKNKCKDCRGTAKVDKATTLEVKVPAGVDSGMRLCLRGEGDPSVEGGPRGDLYVEVAVQPHKVFKRHGNDLVFQLPISYTQAALGAEIEIPVLEGRETLEIPKGTQPGKVFRLRRQGVPDVNGRGHGDLLIEAQVEVPTKLSTKHEELLRELAELEHKDVSHERKSFFETIKDYFSSD